MTSFSVGNSKSVNLVLTLYVLDRTPYRMLGLGTYLVAVSQVLYLTIYNSWEYSVLNTVYDVLLELTGTGIFHKWTS